MRRLLLTVAAVLLLAGCDCRPEGCFGDGRFGSPTPTSTGDPR